MRINIAAILFLAAIVAGCSGSSVKNPVEPNSEFKNQSSIQSNRHLWGIWDITIDADRTSVEITPVRGADMHLNVVKLLEGKACASCLKVSNIKITGPNELSADLTLTHPYPGLPKYTGFDVRGIFISQADYTFATSGRTVALGDTVPRLLDPDGYTSLFNPTEFPPTVPAALGYIAGKHATGGDLSSTLNPFVAYRKDAPRRMFESGGTETKTVKLHAPSGPIHFGYAIDVCWQLADSVIDPVKDFPPDANCLEAYALVVNIGSGLGPDAGSSVPIEVEAYDHQGPDTILSVTMESPGLFNGEVSLAYSKTMPDGGFLYTGVLSNDLGAPVGICPVLIRVTDSQPDQNLGDVAAWQVSTAIVSTPHQGLGWARTWGGSKFDQGYSVVTDGSGNAYVTGTFVGTVDLDPGPGVDEHTSHGSEDNFLSKFDPNGNLLWARNWGEGAGAIDWGPSVAIDGSGNIYVTGWFSDAVDFDPGSGEDIHTSSGYDDGFLSKFDPNGNFIWARNWGGPWSYTTPSIVAIDNSGNAYITGTFMTAVDCMVDFDPGAGVDAHASNGLGDVFISKIDPDGNFIWARTWGSYGADWGLSVDVDDSGDAYISGVFEATVDFDPGPGEDDHTSNSGDNALDTFLSKFDPNGNFVWARTWGGQWDDFGYSDAIDGSGNVCVAGSFTGEVDLDPGPGVDIRTSYGGDSAFLSKFDSNGDFAGALTWGGTGNTRAFSVKIDSSGNAYVAGFFGGTMDLDPGPGVDSHTSNAYLDAFISKFDSSGKFAWARNWGVSDIVFGNMYAGGSSVAVDNSGNMFVTAEFRITSDFDPGPGIDNHMSNGNCDAFLSKFPPEGNW